MVGLDAIIDENPVGMKKYILQKQAMRIGTMTVYINRIPVIAM